MINFRIVSLISLTLVMAIGFSTANARSNTEIILPTDISNPPEIADEGYITFTSSIDFPLSRDTVSEWAYTGFKILAARSQTEYFQKPVDTVALKGKWANVGSVRRIEYADGHFSLETSLLAKPFHFKSLNWGMTRDDRQGVDYSITEYRLEALSEETSRFTWSLHILPNEDYAAVGTERAANNVEQMMDETLYQMFSLASSDFGFDSNWRG